MKEAAKKLLESRDIRVDDLGCNSPDSVDYPDIAEAVARRVSENAADLGVLICGSGQGMAMAANKLAGVRAAVCHCPKTAEMTRRHNNANVLALGADVIEADAFDAIVSTFLNTEFEGGRHERRVERISAIERHWKTGNPE